MKAPDQILAGTIAAWAVVGLAAAQTTWHEAAGVAVTGASRTDGRVFVAAMGCALFLAGYTLVVRGALLGRPLLLATAAAAAAAAHYHVALSRARDTILDTLAEAGVPLDGLGGGGVKPAAYVAAAAAAIALAASVVACVPARRRA